jgi:hypothetical protein
MFEFDRLPTIIDEAEIRFLMTEAAPAYLAEHFGFTIDIPLAVEFTYTQGAECHPLSLAAAP